MVGRDWFIKAGPGALCNEVIGSRAEGENQRDVGMTERGGKVLSARVHDQAVMEMEGSGLG